jgi:SAM-dependent methyltransferase
VLSREPHKQAEIDSRTPDVLAHEVTKPFGWASYHWVRWATISEALLRLEIPRGASVLDLGCGSGWTSLFLAEAGYEVTAVDLVPSNVELTEGRAARWNVSLTARIADMDELELGRRFDFALVYDALHHSTRPRRVLERVAAHLEPGGWVLLGETTWLHWLSPSARRQSRESGWVERGFTLRGLRADLRAAGFVEVRRFFQGTHPYESRGREFAWQLARLVAANLVTAPQTPYWLAARRPF